MRSLQLQLPKVSNYPIWKINQTDLLLSLVPVTKMLPCSCSTQLKNLDLHQCPSLLSHPSSMVSTEHTANICWVSRYENRMLLSPAILGPIQVRVPSFSAFCNNQWYMYPRKCFCEQPTTEHQLPVLTQSFLKRKVTHLFTYLQFHIICWNI